ncbi:c-type cytochrome [Roseivivax sp. CAU 1753]
MTYRSIGLIAGLGLATALAAHEGVKDPVVVKRMALMTDIKEDTAVLGGMVKGRVDFDAALAAEIKAALVDHARLIPEHFEPRADDPKSEAMPDIWRDWKDFEDKSEAMRIAAEELDTTGSEALRASFGQFARSCRACHENYRSDE